LVAVLLISYIAVLWRGVFVHATQIARKVVEQAQAEKKVRHDELTNLPNRLAFFEALEDAFARLVRVNERFVVLYLDLNDFKSVNDTHGHAFGDKLLIQVGQRLRDCVRNIDLVARLSGDEFAVVMADTVDRSAATTLAKRIVGRLDLPFVIDGVEIFSGACVGIAFAPTDGTGPELILKRADEALYNAKNRSSGGVIQLYDPNHKDVTRQRRKLERDLRVGLQRQEFFIVYQPIVALNDSVMTGCEALLRWRHPADGVQSASEFLRVMETTGLINEIGSWIFREACRARVSWQGNLRVAVNVSAVQLRQPTLLSSVIDALKVSNLQSNRFEIEITETAVIDDSAQVLSNLRGLRELGIRIALDDFGTGYSSLTYLRKLSPDSIKIDGSFVRELTTDDDCASIVKSLINLSRDLGIKVVAEGIETYEQLQFLRDHGCQEGQGYLIGMPKSASEIGSLLLNRESACINAA